MNFNNNETTGFKELRLSTTTAAAGEYAYEIKLQNDGMVVEYYYEFDYKTIRKSFYKAKLGLDKYEELNKLLNDYKINKWNGWHKTNPFVLDGGGFSFKLITKDNQTIIASGTNAYPKNYGKIHDAIEDVCSKELIKETSFKCNKFKTKLPETWVNNVKVRYEDGFMSFSINLNDTECSLLNVYYNTYGYYDGDEYIRLGEKRIGEETEYLFLAKDSMIDSYKKEMNDLQLTIVNDLNNSIDMIIKNLKY